MNNFRIRLKLKGRGLKQERKATVTPKNMLNFFIVYELDIWSQDLNIDVILKDCLFGAVNLTKDADPGK